MHIPKSVLVVYERQTFRDKPNGYKLLQINVKTFERENITLFSKGNIPTIPIPYFDSIYDIHNAVLNHLQSNDFAPHYWREGAITLLDIDFLNISNPTELKRYYF